MREYLLFLKDKSLLTSILIIILIEILFQFGFYKSFLKKNSYSSNVNRILNHAISRKEELDPDILILGTSLAYEGISIPTLNQNLQSLNLKAQSIAIPGAELIVQQLALEKALLQFKNVKYIIHVNELETPWTVGQIASTPTLAMVGEFNRIRAIEKLIEDEYKVGFSEFSQIIIRLWSYRQDLRDFFLNPQKRIKDIGRAKTNFIENLYTYQNTNLESLELYPFQNLTEALDLTNNVSTVAVGSSNFHREAIYKTSKLAKEINIPLNENDSTKLFKRRISTFYKMVRARNIKIINVFPPLSKYVEHFNQKERILFWENNYKDILGDKILNLTDSIPKENNASYFYDIVHPNQKGMKLFTDKLSESLILYFQNENKVIK